MEKILICLLVLSNSILVRSDDNVAMESSVSYQGSYKVHPDPEDDQQAAGYHHVPFGKGAEIPSKDYQDGRQNQIQAGVEKLQLSHGGQNVQLATYQKTLSYLPQDLRHQQAGEQQPGAEHQVYLQQYPNQQVHIFGAEASSLQQINENDPHKKTLGYSSYVEHLTEKDEEEIKSALKEGSVDDLRRLVPKSGISFKIYHKGTGGNSHEETHKTGTHVGNFKTGLESSVLGNLKKPGTEGIGNLHLSTHQTGHESGVLGNLHLSTHQTGQEGSVHGNLHLGTHQGHEGLVLGNLHQTSPEQTLLSTGTLKVQENVQQVKHNSELHHRIKVDVPETPFRIQAVQHEFQAPQQVYQQNHIADQQFETSQKTFQTVGKVSHVPDAHSVQTVYYTRPEDTPHKPSSFVNVKGPSALDQSHFKIKVQDEAFKKPAVEFNRNVNSLNGAKLTKAKKVFAQTASKSHHHRHWNSGKTEGQQKSVKQLNLAAKPLETVKYQIDPLALAEGAKGAQNGFVHHGTTSGNSFAGHLTTTAGGNAGLSSYATHPQVNLEAIKSTHNSLISNHGLKTEQHNRLTTGGLYANNEGLNAGHVFTQNNLVGHLTTSSYSDSEPAKSSQHAVVAATTQNNFDHQKALEGSTSFDIKNAIGNTETLAHQTVGYSEIQQHLDKQPLTFVLPKIPTSTVLLGNNLHESSGHHFTQSFHSPVVSEVSGKYLPQHQTIAWSPEQLKQEHVLTATDLHQPVIKLHLPKEELLHQIKTQTVDFPTSFVSHNSFGHHKQQFGIYPTGKFPQEFHFQPKKNVQLQNIRINHVKPAPQLAIDWSLFKTQYPQFNSVQLKPEVLTLAQDSGKKIVPILVRKRKNRSSKDTGVVYGKVNNNRRPKQPSPKNVQFNLLPEASNTVNQYSGKGERKNEFSVSASYKVDRSLQNSDSS